MRTISILFACCFAVASSAWAQQPTAAPQGIYVAAVAGAAFEPRTTPAFGVEFGDLIHRNVQAFITASYFENLMSQDVRDDLTVLSTALTTVTGAPWHLRGRDRGTAVVIGAKYLVPGDRLRPYIGAGGGVLNLRRTITEARLGNIVEPVLAEFAIGDVALTSRNAVRPLVEATTGIGIYAGRTYVDVGYRYRRAYRLSETFDFSQLVVGIGVNF
jgi:hypothetical protein